MPAHDKLASAQSPDERFDVVDERDEVVGTATRREVHARQMWHRAVHVWVFASDGRLFLQKRSRAKDSSPGLWDSSCSGHLDAGEGYDAAAWRELGEEIGLRLSAPPARWFKVPACAETGWEFVWVYRTTSEGPFELNPAEVESGAWYGRADLQRALVERPGDFTRPFRFLWAYPR